MMAAPHQTGAFTASATRSPRITTDNQIAGSTKGTAMPHTAVANPTNIIATNAIGQTRMARPPAIAPHIPTASIATRWSAPWSGWTSPEANEEAYSIIICSLANRVVNRDELRPVGKRRFHLHFGDHVGNTVHDLIPCQHSPAFCHEVRDRLSVPRSLQHDIRDKGDGFRIIQLEASRETPSSDDRRERDHQLVPFTWREIHLRLRRAAALNTTTSS